MNKNIEALYFKAIQDGNIKTLKACLPYINDINILNTKGQSGLHIAAYNCNSEIIEILLDAGAEVNCTTADTNITPLHILMNRLIPYDQNLKCLKILLESGADVNRETDGKNSLDIMINKLLNLIEYSNDYAKLNLEVPSKVYSAIELLCDKGLDINHTDNNNDSVIARVCKHKYCNIMLVKFLHQMGADIEIVNQDNGQTLLYDAIFNHNNELVKFLLTNGLEINHHDESGMTPLYYSMLYDYDDITEILDSYGASLVINSAIDTDYNQS